MARRKKASTTKKPRRFRLRVYTAAYVHISDIVPSSWEGWFYTLVSETAPFTWGDNDVSLITADSFRNYCEKILVSFEDDEQDGNAPQQEINDFLTRLRGLGNIYVDMECQLSMASQ